MLYISGTAPIINGTATVTVSGLECGVTYTITAGGTLNEDLVGPRSSHGTITAGPCPIDMTSMYITCQHIRSDNVHTLSQAISNFRDFKEWLQSLMIGGCTIREYLCAITEFAKSEIIISVLLILIGLRYVLHMYVFI